MERLPAMLAIAAVVIAAAVPLLALLARKGGGRILPRDFDFTHYKRIEHK